ncbi:uncharacterized protein TNCV_4510101 [Trichonephila clavipes]|nr:uncharacterized protein TNCV_4510101 [Trichonephila clavipes]
MYALQRLKHLRDDTSLIFVDLFPKHKTVHRHSTCFTLYSICNLEIRVLDIHRDNQSLRSLMEPKQSFWLRGKNRLRIFTLRLTGGAHRYHCSHRKQKPTSDINKVLSGGAKRTSLNQSPGDQSRRFSTADSHWLGTRACAVLAISLRCQSMFRYFTARLEISHVEAWRVGCHLSCPPRHSTEVPNLTVYERRVRNSICQ